MHSASPRSAFKLRSWNSSKMMQPNPERAESSCSRRVSIPSVTTSMRVSPLTRVSNRVRNPTVRPTGSPNSADMRMATPCRDASRLEHQDLLPLEPGAWQQRNGYDGALSGPRGRLDEHTVVLEKGLVERRKGLIDGQIR